MKRSFAPVAIIAVMTLTASPAFPVSAQAHTGVISGKITTNAGRPVAGAEALLSGTQIHATSDSSGGFLLRDIPPGRYALVVRRVGYEPRRLNASVFADDTIEAPIVLQASAVQLDTVVSKARLVPRQDSAEFATIRKTGIGILIDSGEIAKHPGDRVTDVLRYRLTGVDYYNRRCGGIAVASANGVGTDPTVKTVECGMPNACYVQLYVDGVRQYSYNKFATPPDMNQFDISMIEAVEVFQSGARTPAEYNSSGAGCGTIVIWLKR